MLWVLRALEAAATLVVSRVRAIGAGPDGEGGKACKRLQNAEDVLGAVDVRDGAVLGMSDPVDEGSESDVFVCMRGWAEHLAKSLLLYVKIFTQAPISVIVLQGATTLGVYFVSVIMFDMFVKKVDVCLLNRFSVVGLNVFQDMFVFEQSNRKIFERQKQLCLDGGAPTGMAFCTNPYELSTYDETTKDLSLELCDDAETCFVDRCVQSIESASDCGDGEAYEMVEMNGAKVGVCLSESLFSKPGQTACDENGLVYRRYDYGAIEEIGLCPINTSCVEGVCKYVSPNTPYDGISGRLHQGLGNVLLGGDAALELRDALSTEYGIVLQSANNTIWQADQLRNIYTACRQLPDWWCADVIFVADSSEETAGTDVTNGIVVIGGRSDQYAIVHELVHLHRVMYGVDITAADYSTNYVFYREYYDDDYAIYQEFMHAAGWTCEVDEFGECEGLVLIRDNRPLRLDVANRDEYDARRDYYLATEHIQDEAEYYGVAGQITEHMPAMAEKYFLNSLEMKYHDPALHDFYSTHFFDGREYYLGQCGYAQPSEGGGVVFTLGSELCEN